MTRSQLTYRTAYFAATGFWSGCSPVMPGTVGSVAAFLLSLPLFLYLPQDMQVIAAAVLAIGCMVIGTPSCAYLLRNGNYTSEDDPREFVIDEFAGYFVSVAGLTHSIPAMLVALFFFRVFDVLKPPPVSTLDNIKGAWGIMLDDLAAGVYAALVTRVLITLWG